MTDWWPVSPGNVPLLGSLCLPVLMRSTVDRKRMELPNITAVAGKVKGTWPHTVLGLKLAAWQSSINNVNRWGEVAAVVPQVTRGES